MRVLFIGNSHTYVNDLPERFRRIAGEAGISLDVTMLASPGKTLLWHAGQPETGFNILYGNYDFIVLQNAAHPFAGEAELMQGIEALQPYLTAVSAKVCLYMTWCEQRFPEKQAVMTAAYLNAGKRFGCAVAPVGMGWKPDFYCSDGEHASPAGSEYAAKVIFQTLFPADA